MFGGLATIGSPAFAKVQHRASVSASGFRVKAFELEEATIADLQASMKNGKYTAVALATKYLARIEEIDKRGPALNAVIELNPDALAIARTLDQERKTSGPRGPLHGIPMLIKDNLDTHDRMTTTAGSQGCTA